MPFNENCSYFGNKKAAYVVSEYAAFLMVYER